MHIIDLHAARAAMCLFSVQFTLQFCIISYTPKTVNAFGSSVEFVIIRSNLLKLTHCGSSSVRYKPSFSVRRRQGSGLISGFRTSAVFGHKNGGLFRPPNFLFHNDALVPEQLLQFLHERFVDEAAGRVFFLCVLAINDHTFAAREHDVDELNARNARIVL